ncbi:MAG: chorismate mutase [Bacteroidota bacterium]
MARRDQKSLEVWRRRIDELDRKLLELLNDRARCADEIGRLKQDLGIEVYSREREEQIIRNVFEHNPGPLTREAVQRLFERIIDESRRREREAMERRKRNEDGKRRV